MPYVTGFERRTTERGLSKGLSQGQLEGLRDTIQAVLEVRFGRIDPQTLEELKAVTDIAVLQSARAIVQTVESVEALRGVWMPTVKS